jgi:hypothetical protein
MLLYILLEIPLRCSGRLASAIADVADSKSVAFLTLFVH